uniref:Uncharacterized protein n=1 Tax=Manihot esculenta TaxID=3983 RepID=A0A2C9VYU4_MANES
MTRTNREMVQIFFNPKPYFSIGALLCWCLSCFCSNACAATFLSYCQQQGSRVPFERSVFFLPFIEFLSFSCWIFLFDCSKIG